MDLIHAVTIVRSDGGDSKVDGAVQPARILVQYLVARFGNFENRSPSLDDAIVTCFL